MPSIEVGVESGLLNRVAPNWFDWLCASRFSRRPALGGLEDRDEAADPGVACRRTTSGCRWWRPRLRTRAGRPWRFHGGRKGRRPPGPRASRRTSVVPPREDLTGCFTISTAVSWRSSDRSSRTANTSSTALGPARRTSHRRRDPVSRRWREPGAAPGRRSTRTRFRYLRSRVDRSAEPARTGALPAPDPPEAGGVQICCKSGPQSGAVVSCPRHSEDLARRSARASAFCRRFGHLAGVRTPERPGVAGVPGSGRPGVPGSATKATRRANEAESAADVPAGAAGRTVRVPVLSRRPAVEGRRGQRRGGGSRSGVPTARRWGPLRGRLSRDGVAAV